jgi:hypothetical protein
MVGFNLKEFFAKTFTDAKIQKRIEIIENGWNKNPYFLGQQLFPTETTPDEVVMFAESVQTNTPADYRPRFGQAAPLDPAISMTVGGLTLPAKGGKQHINKDAVNWLKYSIFDSAKAYARMWESVNKQLNALAGSIALLTEWERFSILTKASLTVTHSQSFTIPFVDIIRTPIAGGPTGMAYHENWDWFENGVLNSDADILEDIEGALAAIRNRGGQRPKYMIMNSNTWQSIRRNETLNEKDIEGLRPVYWNEVLQKPNQNLYGLTPIFYDEVYHVRNVAGSKDFSTQMFLPDNYIIFTPGVVGNTWVGANDYTFGTGMFGKTYQTEGSPLSFFEVGEVSMPFPLDLRSTHIAYVNTVT